MFDWKTVACRLTDAEFRKRKATLLAAFKAGVEVVEELDHGYAFRVPGDKHWLALAADLMAAERECCRFLTFNMTAEANLGAVTVRITGPEGTKEFLREMLATSQSFS
jgi:hypothetical protein